MNSEKNISFVTGGTGMLGAHLLLQLLKSGHKVRALKRENSDLSVTSRVFHYFDSEHLLQQIEWKNGDVLNIDDLNKTMKGCTHLYHCAAIVSFLPEQHDLMMKINIEGTKNVMKVAQKINIQKVIHVSSIASFGRANEFGFVDENCQWTHSTNSSRYSASKHESENIVWDFIKNGLNAVIVNPSVIIGAGNWHKGSSELITTVYRGLKIYTKGVNGYVDVRDVAQIMVMLMKNSVSGERFILNSENLSYKELFTYIAEGLGTHPPKIYISNLLGGLAWRITKIISFFSGRKPVITKETAQTAMKKYEYSNKKLCETIDYTFIPMKQSIDETCHFFLKDIQQKK